MKTFKDINIGDVVIVYDEYSHDYIEHSIKITSKNEDSEYITKTNAKGIHFFGEDLDFDEDDDEYISNVHEGNFVCFEKDADRIEIIG